MRVAALLFITAAGLNAGQTRPDTETISAQARTKLQRQLNGTYGVGRTVVRSVELVAADNRRYEDATTVRADVTNLVLPLTGLSSDDALIGRRAAQHVASVAHAIDVSPFVSQQNELPASPEAAASDRGGNDDFCGRPAVRRQTRSLDGGFIYQQVCRWVTSDVIIQIRVSDGRLREVGPGNSLAVIRNGPWRGHLLLSRHKYHPGGGSYDPTFVVRPDGTEMFVIPGSEASEEAVQAWLDRNGWRAS